MAGRQPSLQGDGPAGIDTYGTFLHHGVAMMNVDVFAREFWNSQMELHCELGLEGTAAFEQVKAKILTHSPMEQQRSFIHDMEQGGYCYEGTNAARRLNDVIRKYEKILQDSGINDPSDATRVAPSLRRQNASHGDKK